MSFFGAGVFFFDAFCAVTSTTAHGSSSASASCGTTSATGIEDEDEEEDDDDDEDDDDNDDDDDDDESCNGAERSSRRPHDFRRLDRLLWGSLAFTV